MSGPLRRTKRSRPADAGEPLPEGRAAETEGAAPTAETPPAAPETGGEDAMPAEAVTSDEATTPVEADKPAETAAPAEAATSEEATTPAEAEKPADTATAPEATTPAAPSSPTAAAAPDTSAETPAPDESADATPEGEGQEAGPGKRRRRWRPFRKAPKAAAPAAGAATPPAPVPVLLADPGTPAGVDPTDAPMRPPAGRRGRLRRRLRYLRRARELMLRDLGGLLYEVHRSGGGNVDAHATVIGAKVQRIAGLDAEAHALETALGAPRGETVVFEPGVGGTCATCGELYSSDAHFCANCGAVVGAAAPVAPAADTQGPVVAEDAGGEPARRAFWRRVVRPSGASPSSETPAENQKEQPPATADDATAVEETDRPATTGDEPTAVIPPTETSAPPAGDTAVTPPAETAPPAADEQAGDPPAPRGAAADATGSDPAAGEPGNPSSGARNGRPDSHTPPEQSPGHPLMSKESRS